MHSVKIYSLHSTLPRLGGKMGERVPCWAQGGSALEPGHVASYVTVQVGTAGKGQVSTSLFWDRGTLSLIFYPPNL